MPRTRLILVLLIALSRIAAGEDKPKTAIELRWEKAAAALKTVFGKNASAYPQNDGVTLVLASRSDELLPKAGKLDAEIREQVDTIVVQDEQISEIGFKALLLFGNIDHLDLSDMKKWKPEVEGLIVGLPKLKKVDAQQMGLTNKELAIICKAKGLECLWVDGNKFSLGGCAPLAELNQLRELILDGSDINDDDILSLKDKRELRWLYLNETNVTEKGVTTLKATLSSKCLVFFGRQRKKSGGSSQ